MVGIRFNIVIASEAKQSMATWMLRNGLLRCARNDANPTVDRLAALVRYAKERRMVGHTV